MLRHNGTAVLESRFTARKAIKRISFAAAACAAAPLVLLCRLMSVVVESEAAFQCCSHLLALFPGIVGDYLRLGYYSLSLQRCSSECTISFGTIFSTRKCEIGRYAFIGAYCVISDSVIEDEVLIGSGVHLISGKHVHGFSARDVAIRLQQGQRVPIKVGKGTWIGDRAVVMADIGSDSVIGAGSVVTREIPKLSVAVGNPARVIQNRV